MLKSFNLREILFSSFMEYLFISFSIKLMSDKVSGLAEFLMIFIESKTAKSLLILSNFCLLFRASSTKSCSGSVFISKNLIECFGVSILCRLSMSSEFLLLFGIKSILSLDKVTRCRAISGVIPIS